MPARLLYYAMTMPTGRLGAKLEDQLELSIRSLRGTNPTLDVWLIAYGEVPERVRRLLAEGRVRLVVRPAYEDHLREVLGDDRAEVLAAYPVLPKWLSLAELGERPLDQVVYLDADTYVAAPLDDLLDRCRRHMLYAREEPGSQASGPRCDPGYLDEEALVSLQVESGLAVVRPFQTGVMILNQGAWGEFGARRSTFLSWIWRFLRWMAAQPPRPGARREMNAVVLLRENAARYDRALGRDGALPYPSSNKWIVDEIAAYLTFAEVPGFSVGVLSPGDVAQDDEFLLEPRPGTPSWTLCHYMGHRTAQFQAWHRERRRAPAIEPGAQSRGPEKSWST